MEYLKLFWRHDFAHDPLVLIYEVDPNEDRYATRMINIFADRRVEAVVDRGRPWVTEAPVPTVEEFNTLEYGEEFAAQLIDRDEFMSVWETGQYFGALYYEAESDKTPAL